MMLTYCMCQEEKEEEDMPELKTVQWRRLKIEMNRINQVLPYMQTNKIAELNYAGAKFVWEKIGIP